MPDYIKQLSQPKEFHWRSLVAEIKTQFPTVDNINFRDGENGKDVSQIVIVANAELTEARQDEVLAVVEAHEPVVGEAEDAVKSSEIKDAPKLARQWFKEHSAAVDFVRLTPAEQVAQIDAMTTAQLKTLLKFLTVAVSALIKREFLE